MKKQKLNLYFNAVIVIMLALTAYACSTDRPAVIPQTEATDALNYHRRGLDYSIKGDYDKAIADFNQAIQLNPKFAEAYTGLGAAYSSKGDYDKAITDFNQAIRLNPKLAQAYAGRGAAYAIKGDYDKAIADSNQIILINPKSDLFAEAYTVRGVAYLNKGDKDRALQDITKACSLGSNNACNMISR